MRICSDIQSKAKMTNGNPMPKEKGLGGVVHAVLRFSRKGTV